MTQVERLAEFAMRASYDDLSEAARDQLKIRVLDSLACANGAMDGEPLQLAHDQVTEFDPSGACTLIGGGRTAPDRALRAQYRRPEANGRARAADAPDVEAAHRDVERRAAAGTGDAAVRPGTAGPATLL